MKRIYLITRQLIISLFLINTFCSQSIFAQKSWNFGAKAGINFADLFGDTFPGSTFKPGLAVGVFAEMPFSQKFTFAGELLYSQEGSKNYNSQSYNDVVYKITLRYNYINIPLLARYHISKRWHIHAGPQFGFILCAKEIRKVKSGIPAEGQTPEGTRNIKGRLRPFYISFFVGGEYAINEKMHIQARFYSSFFDNVKKNAGDSEGTYPLVFQFTYAFKLYNIGN